jgi:hypothetical protein
MILATQDVEIEAPQFKGSLCKKLARSHLNKISMVWWYVPVVSAAWKT